MTVAATATAKWQYTVARCLPTRQRRRIPSTSSRRAVSRFGLILQTSTGYRTNARALKTRQMRSKSDVLASGFERGLRFIRLALANWEQRYDPHAPLDRCGDPDVAQYVADQETPA